MATEKDLLSGAFQIWGPAVERQVDRVVAARRGNRRQGLKKVGPDEFPDVALLLEALRAVLILSRAALSVFGDTFKPVHDKFCRMLPDVEKIRTASTYHAKSIAYGRLSIEHGPMITGGDLEFEVALDDETCEVSKYVVVVKGVGRLSVLDAAAAVAELSKAAFAQSRSTQLLERFEDRGGSDQREHR